MPKKKERGPQTPQIQGQVFGTRPGAKGSKVFRGATAEGKKFGGLGDGDCPHNAFLGEVSVKVAGYLGSYAALQTFSVASSSHPEVDCDGGWILIG